MKRTVCYLIFSAIILSTLMTSMGKAQDDRRAGPAFPIAAGQKMIVFPGNQFEDTTTWSDNRYYSLPSGGFSKRIILNLPVGARIRRLLGNFVDVNTEPAIYLTIDLVRLKDDGGGPIVLRSFTTQGITSTNTSDYRQVVGNPLDHVVLQNSSYYIRITTPAHQGPGELRVGEIKLIYEP